MSNQIFCKICGIEIKSKDTPSPLGEMGIIIAQCPAKHYTIHIATEIIVGLMGPITAEYIYINGFEINRLQDLQKNTSAAWRGNVKIWEKDYSISDDELLIQYERFKKLQVMT